MPRGDYRPEPPTFLERILRSVMAEEGKTFDMRQWTNLGRGVEALLGSKDAIAAHRASPATCGAPYCLAGHIVAVATSVQIDNVIHLCTDDTSVFCAMATELLRAEWPEACEAQLYHLFNNNSCPPSGKKEIVINTFLAIIGEEMPASLKLA